MAAVVFELRGDGVVPIKHSLLEITASYQPNIKMKVIMVPTLSSPGFLGTLILGLTRPL